MKIISNISAAILALSLTSSAFAADTSTLSPLAAGKPAGVQKAQEVAPGVWWFVGIAAVAAVLVVSTQRSQIEPSATGTSP